MISVSQGQLFEGQTTHALTDIEKEELLKKFNLTPISVSSHPISTLINRLGKVPTGAQVLRQMIVSKSYFSTKNSALYSNGSYSDFMVGNSSYSPLSFLNEFISMEQKNDSHTSSGKLVPVSAIAQTSETQALNRQLALEMDTLAFSKPEIEQAIRHHMRRGLRRAQAENMVINGILKPDAIKYSQVYSSCFRLWLKYAENPASTPTGYLVFQSKSPHLQEAKKAYAHQMASYHTRSLFIKDFILHSQIGVDKNKLVFDSSLIIEAANNTQQSDKNNAQAGLSNTVPIAFVEGMKKRNPFIRQTYFNPIRRSLIKGQGRSYMSSFSLKQNTR